jgi:integrase
VKLADDLVRRLTSEAAAQRDVWDSIVPGLGLRVTSRGLKTWFIRYSIAGRKRRLKLGTFPALSVPAAREAARERFAAIGAGRDPQAERAADRVEPTLGEIAAQFLEEYAKPKVRRWRDYQYMLEMKELRPLMKATARYLTRKEIRAPLRIIAKRAPVHACNIHRCLHKAFAWAADEEIIPANPMAGMKAPGRQSKPRPRVLTSEELKAFWLATFDSDQTVGAATRVRLLTGQRFIEITKMRWQDLEAGANCLWWSVPGAVTKNGQPHRVPILGLALVEVETLRAQAKDPVWVFKSPRWPNRPIDQDSAKWMKRCWDRSGVVGAEGKDLRRTWATLATRSGVPPERVSLCLNHTPARVAAVTSRHYDQYAYDPEKLAAFQAQDATLRAILGGGGSVVAMQRVSRSAEP